MRKRNGSSAFLRIVEEIGDPYGDTGAEIEAAWQSLLEPLPLLGDDCNPERLASVLLSEFPHMRHAIDRVVGDLVLRRRAGLPGARFRPLLLLGPPGVGKTAFAKRLAALLDLPYAEIAGAGSSDDRVLRGTARG